MSHYSNAQIPRLLSTWAWASAQMLARRYGKGGTQYGVESPVLVYTGMSGVASATALVLAMERLPKSLQFAYGMAYIRKEHEKSHGQPVEFEWVNTSRGLREAQAVVFVDDFICLGTTVMRCIQVSKTHCALRASRWDEHTLCLLSSKSVDLPHHVLGTYLNTQAIAESLENSNV